VARGRREDVGRTSVCDVRSRSKVRDFGRPTSDFEQVLLSVSFFCQNVFQGMLPHIISLDVLGNF